MLCAHRPELENDPLVRLAPVNRARQFAENPDFEQAVVDAISDNQGAHDKIADYFWSAPGLSTLILALARAIHEVADDVA